MWTQLTDKNINQIVNVYVFICKLCPKNDNFYVGQTTNTCRGRNNGHRGKFNVDSYKQSALSYHIFEDHPDHVALELKNFSLGIITSTSPQALDRLEDFYVEWTDAELSLNRYKVTERWLLPVFIFYLLYILDFTFYESSFSFCPLPYLISTEVYIIFISCTYRRFKWFYIEKLNAYYHTSIGFYLYMMKAILLYDSHLCQLVETW